MTQEQYPMENTQNNTTKEVIVGIKRYRNQTLSEQLNLFFLSNTSCLSRTSINIS